MIFLAEVEMGLDPELQFAALLTCVGFVAIAGYQSWRYFWRRRRRRIKVHLYF